MAGGYLAPFLENDEVLANMNSAFRGNYLGERTLLSAAREAWVQCGPSVGKLGPYRHPADWGGGVDRVRQPVDGAAP